MSGPFAGLRVLELGRFIAVPLCGQLMAEGGADVIKVEDLDGDQTRHNGPILPFEGKQYLNKNRGKRSLSAQLSDPEVLGAVRELAAKADVVLANFRPGLARELGLDYESVRAANPQVVYAENTAYGLKGPMGEMPGMDIAVQGYVGFAHLSERGPEQQAYPLIDHAASMLMAWGVAAALYHRERTGAGQKLDVALMQAAMLLSNNWLTHVDAVDGWREEFLSYLKTAFAEGKTWAEVLKHRDELQPHRTIRAYYGFFDTADGSVGIACNARTLRLRMIQILGIDDRWTTEPGWLPDDVEAHEVYVREQVLERLKANTSAHWIEVFRAKGLPIGPVRLPDEMFDDPQAWDNEFFSRVEHELLGGITVVSPPVKFSQTPLEAKPSPPLGKHTREALREGGLNDEQIAGLFERGVVREINSSEAQPE